MQDPNKFLMGGGGAPAAKFPTIGTSATGRITEEPTVQHQTDFDTGKPLYWEDGNPRMQLVVTLATEQRDPANPDDDGKRRVYIKGQLKTATVEALRKTGAQGLEVGGALTVTYVADGDAKGRGKPPKQYAVTYTPAAQAELAAPTAPTPAVPAPGQAPAAVTPEQLANAANNPQIAALLAQLQQPQQQ
jgi:hypothetical protein